MPGNRIIVLSALAIGVLMVLFPPWSIRSLGMGEYRWTAGLGPEHAGRYAFIATPPNSLLSGWRDHEHPGGGVVEGATVDLGRLLLQFVALGLVAGGAVVALGMPCGQRETTDQGEREAKLKAA